MKKIINTPINDKDIEDLRAGDVFYITGHLVLARDDCHRRVVEEKRLPEFDLKGMAVMHAGPIVRKTEDGYSLVSVGPTTSMRMEKYQKEFIEATGIKVIVGKGGMGAKTQQACVDKKVIHSVFPGGCAVIAADQVKRIIGVEWEDFGMPESLWILEVKEFGPLTVSIDTKGNNLFEKNKELFNNRKEAQIKEIFGKVRITHE